MRNRIGLWVVPLLGIASAGQGRGTDLDTAVEAISEVWLGSLAPLEIGSNLWEDYSCDSAYPIVHPSTGVVRAQAFVDKVELVVESLNPTPRRARLNRIIFVSPVIIFSTLVGPSVAESHSLSVHDEGVSLADLLTYPDLEVELLDVTGGRLRFREQRKGGGYDIDIVDIRLQGRDLDSYPAPGQPQMILVGSGRIAGEGRGRLSLQWFAVPGDGTADMTFSVGLDELDLSLLTPLMTDEAELSFAGGKLSLLVNGKCREGRYLHTDNHLILEDVRLVSGSEDSLGELSLATVVGLLGDMLTVEFPIDGDLLNPDFDLLEAYAEAALLAALNQTVDRLLSKVPSENRAELKHKLLDWVAPELPESQKRAILGKDR